MIELEDGTEITMMAAAELTYAALKESKFDVVCSNPPYQEETTIRRGSDTSATNVFQYFYGTAIGISNSVSMVFPGGRWMQRSGKCGGIYDLIVPTVNSIDWYPNGDEDGIEKIFQDIRISDGISIVGYSTNKFSKDSIILNGEFYSRPKAREILPLTKSFINFFKNPKFSKSIVEQKQGISLYGLLSDFVAQSTESAIHINKPHDFSNPIKAFLGNETPGKSKRVEEFWVDSSSITWSKNNRKIYKSWKVIGSQGQVSKAPSTTKYFTVDNEHIVGWAWTVLNYFDTEIEANNFVKYLDTLTVRLLLDESKGSKSIGWGSFVPDLEDYTDSNPLFQTDEQLGADHEYYRLELNERLYRLFELTEEEIATVELSRN